MRLLSATLAPPTVSGYNHTLRLFLGYMRQNHPGIGKPAQLTILRNRRPEYIRVIPAELK